MYLLFKAFLGGKDNSNHFRTDLNYNYSLVWYDMKKIKYRVMIAILCNIFDIMKPKTWEKASSGKVDSSLL